MQHAHSLRLPAEFRRSLMRATAKAKVSEFMRAGRLSTVCEEARCPNIGECFSQGTATFMIMGDRCTRRCGFCAVTTKKPLPLNESEPKALLDATKKMALDYIVITSVDRDDLPDLGAQHFANVLTYLKENLSHVKIEVLVPDFKARAELLDLILESPIEVFGHNIETIPRLYKKLRPQSDFLVTSHVLRYAAEKNKAMVKSSMMLGLGETDDEVCENMSLLKDLGVSIVSLGQYLRPSLKHWPVDRYVAPESYTRFIEHGQKIGLKKVFAGPFVRSSYHAKEVHDSLFA
jgi:lipoic acid synthetase